MIEKNNYIKITECPRDAMQGIKKFIPTEQKVNYLNSLLKVGFDIIDFGSFVSPKAVPQMKDTSKLLNHLEINNSNSSLLSVVLNKRGACDAAKFDEIEYIGYPFSISEIFQKKNSNKSIDDSVNLIDDLVNITFNSNKKLLVYISMAFGNIYNEDYSPDLVYNYIEKFSKMGVSYFTLADTVGIASPELIKIILRNLDFKSKNIGVHFHSHPDESYLKIKTAFECGCRRFDSSIYGIGGCPFAKDDLVGNISTQAILNFSQTNKINHNLNMLNFESSCNEAKKIFKF